MIKRLLPIFLLLYGCGTLQKQKQTSFGGAWESPLGLSSYQPHTAKVVSDTVQVENDTPKCDLIILNNGDEINAIVSEIGLTEVKYKRCDNLQGPVISIYKKDVFMIKYRNGTKDVIKNMPGNVVESTTPANPQTHVDSTVNEEERFASLGALGTVAAILGWLLPVPLGGAALLGLIGLIFGLTGVIKNNANPKKYYGKIFNVIAIILSLILIFALMILAI